MTEDRKAKKQLFNLHLQIHYLQKERAVQYEIIQQLKNLHASSCIRNVKFCDAGHQYVKSNTLSTTTSGKLPKTKTILVRKFSVRQYRNIEMTNYSSKDCRKKWINFKRNMVPPLICLEKLWSLLKRTYLSKIRKPKLIQNRSAIVVFHWL